LGAVPLGERVVLEDETYRVYADPAGDPFCLVQLETTWTAEPSSSGDLDPLSGHRRAEHLDGDHTLDCEEPPKNDGATSTPPSPPADPSTRRHPRHAVKTSQEPQLPKSTTSRTPN